MTLMSTGNMMQGRIEFLPVVMATRSTGAHVHNDALLGKEKKKKKTTTHSRACKVVKYAKALLQSFSRVFLVEFDQAFVNDSAPSRFFESALSESHGESSVFILCYVSASSSFFNVNVNPINRFHS